MMKWDRLAKFTRESLCSVFPTKIFFFFIVFFFRPHETSQMGFGVAAFILVTDDKHFWPKLVCHYVTKACVRHRQTPKITAINQNISSQRCKRVNMHFSNSQRKQSKTVQRLYQMQISILFRSVGNHIVRVYRYGFNPTTRISFI